MCSSLLFYSFLLLSSSHFSTPWSTNINPRGKTYPLPNPPTPIFQYLTAAQKIVDRKRKKVLSFTPFFSRLVDVFSRAIVWLLSVCLLGIEHEFSRKKEKKKRCIDWHPRRPSIFFLFPIFLEIHVVVRTRKKMLSNYSLVSPRHSPLLDVLRSWPEFDGAN